MAAGGSSSQCGRQSNLRTWSERLLISRWSSRYGRSLSRDADGSEVNV